MIKKLLLLLICVIIMQQFHYRVDAFNAVSCSDFEVAYIEDNGNFKHISCHSNLTDAKNKMREHPDYVVRHRASDSPMDIVAMNSGIAYIYTHRYSDKATIGLWEKPYDKEFVQSYSDSYRDVFYQDTTEFSTSDGEGTIIGTLNGFTGGIGLEYTDLVPDKFFRLNLDITIGGGYRESSYTFKPQRSYFDVVQNGNYLDLVYHYFPGYAKSGSAQNHYRYAIGPAPSFMEIGRKYYSYNGYDFYFDMEAKQLAGTYYNYYQFLPLRSKSFIKSSSYNKFLDYFEISHDSKLFNSAEFFLQAQEKYGVNAALIFGVAVNESAFGKSYFARERNNLFGLNAVDSDPSLASRYPSIQECIETMFSYYVQSFIDLDDWRFFGSSLGNKGSGLNLKYASDPHWSFKAARYAYALDKIDNDFNGNLTDYNHYTFKKINQFDIPFKKAGFDHAETLDTSKYGKTYQENFMVIPIGAVENGYQKIQFTNPIENGKVLKWKDIQNKTQYDWDQSVAYVKADYLIDVNGNENNKLNYVFSLETVQLTKQGLSLEGVSYDPNLPTENLENKLVIKQGDQIFKEVVLELLPEKTGAFNQIIELDLIDGEYNFEIQSTQSEITTHPIEYDGGLIAFHNKNGLIQIVSGKPLLIRVSRNNQSNNHVARQVVNDIQLNEDMQLHIDGIAFLDQFDISESSMIKHQLVLKNVLTGNEAIEELETYSSTVDLNDGYQYDYIGYRGLIDLTDYRYGKYQLFIRITQNDVTRDITVSSNHQKYDSILQQKDGDYLRLYSKQDDAFRIVLEKNSVKLYNTEYKKPSRRTSFVRLDSIDLAEEKLILEGSGIIFETDHTENTKHILLLVDQQNKVVQEIVMTTFMQDYDLTAAIQYPYQINRSKFRLELPISDLELSNYVLKLKIQTKDYIDIEDLVYVKSVEGKKITSDSKNYSIVKNVLDQGLNLLVKEISHD